MGRACCFSVAIAISVAAMVSLVVAVATDHWFEVRNVDRHVTAEGDDAAAGVAVVTGNATTAVPDDRAPKRFEYPYHVGLWLTCYENKIPDTVKTDNLIRERCVLDYDFESKSIEDFARTSEVCLVIASAIMLVSILLGIAGCTCRRKSPLLLSGIFLFLSAITTLIGMCAFIARILMEQNSASSTSSALRIPDDGEVRIGFCWSFYVGWGSLGLQLLAGAIFVGGVRGCVRARDKDDNFI